MKLSIHSPSAEMPAPVAPPSVPMAKPVRRPKRCIAPDSHGAVVIEPKTISEIGKVARQGLGASIWPASPPTTKIIGIWLPRIACARTRTLTLRQARALSCWDSETSLMAKPLDPFPADEKGAGQNTCVVKS